MKPILSLRRQLLIWLLLPQLVLWLVGGAMAYRIALNYAEKALDQSLLQSVKSLARQIKPIGSGLLVDFPKAAQAIIEEDPDDRVSFPYIDPLHHLQFELIRRFREGTRPQDRDERARRGIHISINGIAAGLRNTG